MGGELSYIELVLTILRGDILSWFRLCQLRDKLLPLKRIIYCWLSRKRHIDMPIETRVGYGLYLGHSMCIVINRNAIIGNNVNLSQFLNIGSNQGKGAVLCDNCYIAPMVCLVEDVVVGFNSRVGAGSVVVHNVPNNVTVAGVPAKIINNTA